MFSFQNSLGVPAHLINSASKAAVPQELKVDLNTSLNIQRSLQDTLETSTFSETSSSDSNTNDSSSDSDSDEEHNEVTIAFNPLDGPSSAPARFQDAEEGDLADAFNSRCALNHRSPRVHGRAVSFSGRIGPQRRIVSTSSPSLAHNKNPPSAPANLTRMPAARSPSVHLRHAAAVNAFHQSHTRPDGYGSESSSDHSQEVDNDSSSDSDEEAPSLAEIRKRNSQRSAASKRLFAALGSRDKSEKKTKGGDKSDEEATSSDSSTSSLPASTPGLAAHRGGNARLPTLDDIRSRVSGKSSASSGIFGGKRSPTSQPANFTPMHNRSVSCPTPKTGNWWQFGDVMVTVTPPTPQMQPKSPLLGYVLQSNGRVINGPRTPRGQDDLACLAPPPFEVAPGRQRIFEERAKAAMAAMAALQAANDQAQRNVNNGCGSLVGLGWPGSSGSECPVPPVMVAAAAAAATVEMPKPALLAPPPSMDLRRMQCRQPIGRPGRQRAYFSPPPARPPPVGSSSPSPPRRQARRSNSPPKIAVSLAAATSSNWRSSKPSASSPPSSPTKASSGSYGESSGKYVAPGRRRSMERGRPSTVLVTRQPQAQVMMPQSAPAAARG